MTTTSQSDGGTGRHRLFIAGAAAAMVVLQGLTLLNEGWLNERWLNDRWLGGPALPWRLAADAALALAAACAVSGLGRAVFRAPLRRARAAALRSERLHRAVVADTADLIGTLDRSGLASLKRRAAARLLGHEDGAARALPLRALVHADDLPAAVRQLRSLGPERSRASLVMRLRHREGHSVFAEVCLCRIAHEDGQGSGQEDAAVETVVILRDVTRRHREAEALREVTIAAQRAQAEADAANRAKSDFLASMSHEIRSPLNSVIGFADLLLGRDDLAGEVRLCGERIRAAGRALLTVVDDILDFSRVEAGAVELVPAPFSLPGLVDECVSIVQGAASAKNIGLHVNLMSRLPAAVLGDKARVRQVLLNLLYNAIKFTREGSVTLDIRAERGAGRMRFSVIDTGIGIARADLSRLFQRFAQVDGSIRRTYGGSGLGLAISKRLVELMDGTIGVDSVADVGSTFWFTVPLPERETAAIEAPAAPAPATRPASILLVDDIAMNQDLVRCILEARGHRVDVVGNGAEAIMAVQDMDYDVVLMDIQMPYVDGLTTTRTIRRLPHRCRDVPIVAVTANVLPEQAAEARRAGMVDIVHKPFSADGIYAVLARVLGAGDAAAGAAAHPGTARSVAAVPASPAPGPGIPAGEADARGASPEFAVLAKLAGLIGEAKVKDLLGGLAASLAGRFAAGPDTAEARTLLKRQAHASVAGSGMLGFTALAASCRAFETAGEDTDLADAWRSLRAEAQAVAEAATRLARSSDPLAGRPDAA